MNREKELGKKYGTTILDKKKNHIFVKLDNSLRRELSFVICLFPRRTVHHFKQSWLLSFSLLGFFLEKYFLD